MLSDERVLKQPKGIFFNLWAEKRQLSTKLCETHKKTSTCPVMFQKLFQNNHTYKLHDSFHLKA